MPICRPVGVRGGRAKGKNFWLKGDDLGAAARCGPLPIIATTAIITLLVGPARLCQQLLAQLRFPSLWVKMGRTPDKSAKKTLGLPHVLLQMTDSKGWSFYLQRVDLVNVAPLNLFLLTGVGCCLSLAAGTSPVWKAMWGLVETCVIVNEGGFLWRTCQIARRFQFYWTDWVGMVIDFHFDTACVLFYSDWLENRLCQTRWMFELVQLVHAPSGDQKNYTIRQAWYSRPRAPLVAGCSIPSTVNLERYHHLKPEKKWRKRQEDTKSPMKYPTH